MWVKGQIDKYIPPKKVHNPREIILVVDATFYAKRKDKIGTLVFKDNLTKEILIWKHISSETVAEYKDLKNQLEKLGYIIKGVTFDGKRGLPKLFKDFPIQMCLFHQRGIINRYLTLNPRLQAGKDLRYIVSRLKYTNEKNFTKKLNKWFEIYENFIDELTVNPLTGECFYKHQKLRAAYRSLRRNLSYLFTYKNYTYLDIPSTTNTLDGGTFSVMKKKLNVHSGMSIELRFKIVDYFLVNYKKK